MKLEPGERIRAARTAQGLSLRAVAADVGISASMLSQVETGKVQPSVSTLYAITNSLGLTVDDVLDVCPAVTRSPTGRLHPIQRCEDAPEIAMENGVTWRGLAVGGSVDGVSAVVATYQPHGASSMDQTHMRHSGTEHGYIIRGEITLKLDFDTYVLRAGDSLCFDSTRPHYYVNHTQDVAEGIWFIADAAPTAGPSVADVDSVRNVVDVLDVIGRLSSRTTR